MRRISQILIIFVTASAFAQYVWRVDEEPRPYGFEGDIPSFVTGDTISGLVHSNGELAIFGSPVFYDRVSTSQDDFYHGEGYDPQFLGPPPLFHAVPIYVPEVAYNLRAWASYYYNPGSNKQMRCRIDQSSVTLWTWDIGEAFDSTNAGTTRDDLAITGAMCLFTECPLELWGTNIQGRITIGSAQQIRLIDDIYVAPPWDGGSPQTGDIRVSMANPNYVGVVSEGNIKIANNTGNGRENSDSLSFDQPNPAFSDIILTAEIVALGSLQIENQNDADSGYVCDCSPDQRGTIWLWGAITQGEHGFHWRTNNGGTGYRLHASYDPRFASQRPPCFSEFDSTGEREPTDTLNFGDVVVGTAVWDTAEIYLFDYAALGGVMATSYYYAVRIPPYFGTHFRVPVRFIPPHVGSFPGVLTVQTSERAFQIPLRGRGVEEGGPQIVAPNAYPNPFNAVTRFTFAMQAAGNVTLEVYDLQGRRVASLLDEWKNAGSHQVSFDAGNLSSGLYMGRLQTPDQERHIKLLLIK